MLRPTGHCGRPALISSTSFSRSFFVYKTKRISIKICIRKHYIASTLTGECLSPSADRHNRVAPHKSIKVPSCRALVSSYTGWPFCCADRHSLRLNTSPPTDVSRHSPHSADPPQNWPLGCMIRTPFVVRPSISTLSCHLVAFSWKRKINIYLQLIVIIICRALMTKKLQRLFGSFVPNKQPITVKKIK